MSGPELFDEETGPSGDDDVYGIDASMDSGSESGSDLESPPRPTATSLTVRNFFSKSKKRQRRTSTGRNELEQHVSRGDRSSGIDRVENSQSKRRRGQLRKDVHAPSVTPNRPASGHSKATPEIPKPSQSKGINENFNPRPAVELNTSASQDDDTSVKSALKEITSLLNTVVERVDRVETELKKQSSASSSSDSTPRTKKIIAVPLIVRSEVRKMYQALLDNEYEGFHGFDVGVGSKFDSQVNNDVVAILLKEVQLANPQFQACQIRAAAYTYYRSLNQEESLRRRGKQDDRKKVRRRRERLLRLLRTPNKDMWTGNCQKLQERQATLKKCTMSERDKEKWGKILSADVMSSEESDSADDVVIVKPLPWRSLKVSHFFKELDQAGIDSKTKQAKRQRKQRVTGSIESERPTPVVTLPSWAYTSSAGTSGTTST